MPASCFLLAKLCAARSCSRAHNVRLSQAKASLEIDLLTVALAEIREVADVMADVTAEAEAVIASVVMSGRRSSTIRTYGPLNRAVTVPSLAPVRPVANAEAVLAAVAQAVIAVPVAAKSASIAMT